MRELKIGRTPIREAVQRLIAEGLVTHLHHRGMLVVDIRAADVQQIYEFRALIEGEAARLAAQRMTPAQLGELQQIHGEMDSSMADHDIDRFVALDRRFHELLGRGSENQYLENVLLRAYNLHLRLWYFLVRKQGGLRETVHEHQAVIEALVARDPKGADLAMRHYVMRTAQQIKDVL